MEDDNSWFAFAPGLGSFQPLDFLLENAVEDVRGDFCVSVGAPGPGVTGLLCPSALEAPAALLELRQRRALQDGIVRGSPGALTQVCCAGVAPLSPLSRGLRQCRQSLL